MVWHYNAFLSYVVEPVEEERVWLDADTANLTQVDLNAYFLANGTPCNHEMEDQLKGRLYAAAYLQQKDEEKHASELDRRA